MIVAAWCKDEGVIAWDKESKDSRRSIVDESMAVVRECKTMAEEALRSGLNEVLNQARECPGKSTREIGQRQEEVSSVRREDARQDFETSEAVLGRFIFFSIRKGNNVDLDFEAVKSVNVGEEQCWNMLIEASPEGNKHERNVEGHVDLSSFCWLAHKRHRCNLCVFQHWVGQGLVFFQSRILLCVSVLWLFLT